MSQLDALRRRIDLAHARSLAQRGFVYMAREIVRHMAPGTSPQIIAEINVSAIRSEENIR